MYFQNNLLIFKTLTNVPHSFTPTENFKNAQLIR